MTEIHRCPNPECNSTADIWIHGHTNSDWYAECCCGYNGPFADSEAEAIRLHNLISAAPDDGNGLERCRKLVEAQSNDEGLWFAATTAPEAYLQQELRRLHGLIEHEANALVGKPDDGKGQPLEPTDEQLLLMFRAFHADKPEILESVLGLSDLSDVQVKHLRDGYIAAMAAAPQGWQQGAAELARKLADSIDFTGERWQAKEAFEAILKRHSTGDQ